jgi:hypothetical protein
VSAPEEREQNWYPVSQVGWFTAHIREDIAVTGHQLELLQLGLARPGRSRPGSWPDSLASHLISQKR